MSKLIELSILIATIAIPARASRNKNARIGLRKMITGMIVFEGCYMLAIRFLHGRF